MKVRVLGFVLVAACSGGGEVTLDYSVRFTDASGRDRGVVESGTLSGLSAAIAQKPLAFSAATFSATADGTTTRFVVTEVVTDAAMMTQERRAGALSCTARPGTSSGQASASLSDGGHYLVVVSAKGAVCIAEQ